MTYYVYDEATVSDPTYGGTTKIAYGTKGSGKSTLITTWLVEALQRHETAIWRARYTDTWNVFAQARGTQLLVPLGSDVELLLSPIVRAGKTVPVLPENLGRGITVTGYTSPEDAVRLLRPASANIIATPFARQEQEVPFWTAFAFYLVRRPDLSFVHFAIDEIDELFSPYPPWSLYEYYMMFRDAFRDFRKTRVQFSASAHIYSDVDYRIENKFRYRAYLQGAMVKTSRAVVKQRYVNALGKWEGIMESTRYQHFEFGPIPEPYRPADMIITRIRPATQDEPRPQPAAELPANTRRQVVCPKCGRAVYTRMPAGEYVRCSNLSCRHKFCV